MWIRVTKNRLINLERVNEIEYIEKNRPYYAFRQDFSTAKIYADMVTEEFSEWLVNINKQYTTG